MLVAALYIASKTLVARKAASAACIAFAIVTSGFTTPPNDRHALIDGRPGPARVLHVIAFGSSSTEGVGASKPSSTYPAQLQTVLTPMMPAGSQVEVANRGIGGQDVDDMMIRLQSDIIAPRPDIVIWQTGSNDPMRHVPLDRFERETRDGILAMRHAGIVVMLMEPQWCPTLERTGTVDSYRDIIRQIGVDLKVPVIRRSDIMRRWIAEGQMTQSQMLSPDGLHMADTGYAALARDIAPMVYAAGVRATISSAVLTR